MSDNNIHSESLFRPVTVCEKSLIVWIRTLRENRRKALNVNRRNSSSVNRPKDFTCAQTEDYV